MKTNTKTEPTSADKVLDTTICSPLINRLVAEQEMTENLYKKMEEVMPCESMSDGMLERMNKSLGFSGESSKQRDYRPYCGNEKCKRMPRMMRVKEGFQCWECHDTWNLEEAETS